ncbi:MAG TPA: 4-hydroxy-tetrahydrodipicolinate synthase [Gammaproteobacteria bacterium]
MFQGSMVALVTPMHPDGGIDRDALTRLIDFHCAQGTAAIVAAGTSGESATLDFDEHIDLIELCVRLLKGRIPLIAGTGANATSEAVHLTRRAKEVGADACLLVTPYYNKPTQEGLYLHHKVVAEAVDIPQILYNVPGRTAVDMQPETVQRLSAIPNIIGIKEATGKIDRVRRILELCPKGFAVYSGDDDTGMQCMLAGGVGVISVTANVAPAAMRALCDACLAGDAKQAVKINGPLESLHRDLFVEANPIPVKWALAEMGLIEAGIRLPLTWLSEPHHATVRAALRKAGLV